MHLGNAVDAEILCSIARGFNTFAHLEPNMGVFEDSHMMNSYYLLQPHTIRKYFVPSDSQNIPKTFILGARWERFGSPWDLYGKTLGTSVWVPLK
jgi:hypothetical protein